MCVKYPLVSLRKTSRLLQPYLRAYHKVRPNTIWTLTLSTLKQPGSSGPKFCTPGMKPPDKFDGENSSKLQGFLQSCKLLFLNDPTVFSDDRKKVLYAALYLGGRASQWFKPYLDLLENQSPSCLINNWDRFEQQLFTLLGDPNEVRNAEFKLNSLSMKDNGKALTYIAQFQTLQYFEVKEEVPCQRNPLRLLRSSTRKDNSIRRNKHGGNEKDFVFIVVGNMSYTLVSNGLPVKLPNWQKK
ncbi:uncharacterized protein VP01_1561g2 [Puccinia sorghi]|uniref:DUF4939 domain-containing protein n=1 Tax=Puccinia sorghi TaxID=27349 RepID=A0A0L6VHZ3_9BASI|nr:uncharacterized protein VP01_1561g2 [Puccinia sorghi]